MGLSSPFVEERRPRNRCTWLWGSSPMDEGRSREGAGEKLLYLVLNQLNEAWRARRLQRFGAIQMGSYHAG